MRNPGLLPWTDIELEAGATADHPALTALQRRFGLHPVIVIVALLIGAEIGGFLGVVIAVPAAAVFQEVIQEWSSKKKAIVSPE